MPSRILAAAAAAAAAARRAAIVTLVAASHTQTCLPTVPLSQRLVKGVFADYTIAGQVCRCSDCQKEHKRLADQLKAAESAHVNATQLSELRAKVKATSYSFMTYDPRVTKHYFDRHPWVAMKLEAFITHKAAISMELLWMLTHSAPKGQTLGGLESMLTTFRALAATTSLSRTIKQGRASFLFSSASKQLSPLTMDSLRACASCTPLRPLAPCLALSLLPLPARSACVRANFLNTACKDPASSFDRLALFFRVPRLAQLLCPWRPGCAAT